MDLSDRPGGEGGRIDRLENILPGHAQFLFRNSNHFVFGHRQHMVLQLYQLVDVLWREEVRACRQHLPEFRKGGT